jgi:hypothetical protein
MACVNAGPAAALAKLGSARTENDVGAWEPNPPVTFVDPVLVGVVLCGLNIGSADAQKIPKGAPLDSSKMKAEICEVFVGGALACQTTEQDKTENKTRGRSRAIRCRINKDPAPVHCTPAIHLHLLKKEEKMKIYSASVLLSEKTKKSGKAQSRLRRVPAAGSSGISTDVSSPSAGAVVAVG